MVRKTFLIFFVLVLSTVGGSCLWAENAPDIVPKVAEKASEPAEAPSVLGKALPEGLPFLPNALEAPPRENTAGCSASYACVHGGSVNCSAPVGTCTSSGQGCGVVVCNGTATFCPGACNGNPWSCASFCYSTYGSMDGYCDSLKCCVCL